MTFNKPAILLSLTLFSLIIASCSKEDDPLSITIHLNQTPSIQYTEDNIWTLAHQPQPLQSHYAVFSHSLDADNNWFGFTPSRRTQTDALSNLNLVTGGGIDGIGTPYFICRWNYNESESTAIDNRSLAVSYSKSIGTDKKLFTPQTIFVCNSAQAVKLMKQGNELSTEFSDNDYLTITAHGLHTDGTKACVDFDLARGKNILETWESFSLESLGTVTDLYFTLKSSRTDAETIEIFSTFGIDALTFTAILPDEQ